MSVDTLGLGGLDYFPCRYGATKITFRGPQRPLDNPFVAIFGGTNTYGKFVQRPFPDLLEDEIDVTCVNLGCFNASIEVALRDPGVIEVLTRADLNLIQVLSPRNLSNRYYKVHPRRNDRFLRPSDALRALYRDVDFSEFNFTKHMLQHLHEVCPLRFRNLVEELRIDWSARMNELIERIPGDTVLFWFSDHGPSGDYESFGLDPWFVTGEMIEHVTENCAGYIEIIASEDAMSSGTEGMVFTEMEAPAARHLLGPLAHREAAQALAPMVNDLIMKNARLSGRAS